MVCSDEKKTVGGRDGKKEREKGVYHCCMILQQGRGR